MDQITKEQIYKKWQLLEKDKKSSIVIGGHGVYPQPNGTSEEIRKNLNRYRKWVLTYCSEFLSIEEKANLEWDGVISLKCKCDDKECSKCLLVNCTEDDCYYHPKEKKDIFKRKYKSQ